MNWKKYNKSLVRRGEILLYFDVIDNWDNEIKEMNKNKKGRKLVYPNSFIKLVGYMRVSFHYHTDRLKVSYLDMLQTHYHQFLIIAGICRRINKLNIIISTDDESSVHADNFVIAIDSTGVKVTNRGEWIRHKWNVRERLSKDTCSS